VSDEDAASDGTEEDAASSAAQGLLEMWAAHGRPAGAAPADHPVTVDSLAASEAQGIIAEAIRQMDASRMSSPVPVQDGTSRRSTPVPVQDDDARSCDDLGGPSLCAASGLALPSPGAGRCAADTAGAPEGVGILGCCMPNTDLEWTQHIDVLDDSCESELSAAAGVVAGRVIASCRGGVDLGSTQQTVASDAYNADDSEAAAAAAAQAICQSSLGALWGLRRSPSASAAAVRSSCSSPLAPDEPPGPGPPPPPLEGEDEAVTVVDADAQGDDSDAEDNVALSLVQQVFAQGGQDFRTAVAG